MIWYYPAKKQQFLIFFTFRRTRLSFTLAPNGPHLTNTGYKFRGEIKLNGASRHDKKNTGGERNPHTLSLRGRYFR